MHDTRYDTTNHFTATKEEQANLRLAWTLGKTIEGKGRDSVHCEYTWAVCENPKWDFENNYYRIKE